MSTSGPDTLCRQVTALPPDDQRAVSPGVPQLHELAPLPGPVPGTRLPILPNRRGPREAVPSRCQRVQAQPGSKGRDDQLGTGPSSRVPEEPRVPGAQTRVLLHLVQLRTTWARPARPASVPTTQTCSSCPGAAAGVPLPCALFLVPREGGSRSLCTSRSPAHHLHILVTRQVSRQRAPPAPPRCRLLPQLTETLVRTK